MHALDDYVASWICSEGDCWARLVCILGMNGAQPCSTNIFSLHAPTYVLDVCPIRFPSIHLITRFAEIIPNNHRNATRIDWTSKKSQYYYHQNVLYKYIKHTISNIIPILLSLIKNPNSSFQFVENTYTLSI